MKRNLLLLILFFQLTTYGQEAERKIPKSDANYLKYLDDGKLDLAKTALTVDLSNILNTEIGFLLEQQIFKGFSLQVGGGIVPKYLGLLETRTLLSGSKDGDSIMKIGYKGDGLGTSFTVMPKFYVSRNGITNGSYIGLKYKHQSVPLQFGGKSISQHYQLIFGSQFIFYKKMAVDYGLGFGFRDVETVFPKSTGITFEEGTFSNATFNVHLGIGLFLGKSQLKEFDGSSKKVKKSNKKEENNED